jgi:hypothetical protein
MSREPGHHHTLSRLAESLSALAERVKAVNLEKPGNILELSGEFEKWTAEAKMFCGPWATTLAAQARQWVKGLEAGRPLLQGLERLLQGVLEASTRLQEEKSSKETTTPLEKGKEVMFFD